MSQERKKKKSAERRSCTLPKILGPPAARESLPSNTAAECVGHAERVSAEPSESAASAIRPYFLLVHRVLCLSALEGQSLVSRSPLKETAKRAGKQVKAVVFCLSAVSAMSGFEVGRVPQCSGRGLGIAGRRPLSRGLLLACRSFVPLSLTSVSLCIFCFHRLSSSLSPSSFVFLLLRLSSAISLCFASPPSFSLRSLILSSFSLSPLLSFALSIAFLLRRLSSDIYLCFASLLLLFVSSVSIRSLSLSSSPALSTLSLVLSSFYFSFLSLPPPLLSFASLYSLPLLYRSLLFPLSLSYLFSSFLFLSSCTPDQNKTRTPPLLFLSEVETIPSFLPSFLLPSIFSCRPAQCSTHTQTHTYTNTESLSSLSLSLRSVTHRHPSSEPFLCAHQWPTHSF